MNVGKKSYLGNKVKEEKKEKERDEFSVQYLAFSPLVTSACPLTTPSADIAKKLKIEKAEIYGSAI